MRFSLLVLLAILRMSLLAQAAQDSQASFRETPYGRDFVILNASFSQPFQFLDLNSTGGELLYSPQTSRQGSTRHDIELHSLCFNTLSSAL
jgi:hypothetical protein